MKLNIRIFLVCLLCFVGIAQSQDNNDPRWNNPNLVVMADGNYTALPYEPYVHPVTQPRIVTTPYEVLAAFPNVRVLPNTNQQTELYLAISRNMPTFMFGSSNRTSGSNINSGSYITTDAGTTWFGQDFINNGNTNNQRGDPGPAIGMNNRVIFSHLTSNTNFGSLTGIGAERSTDFGQTFSATVQLVNDGNADKNFSGADDVPTSPFFGNFYTAWTSFSTSPANGRFSRTTDGGVTWTAPIVLNTTPAGHNAQGHDVLARPNGDVIVCWTAGVTSAPFTEDFCGVARSTNGGVNFTATENAFDCNGSRSTSFNGWGIRTNGFPRIACDKSGGSRNGWLYIVVSQLNLAPAGSDADIVLHRSTDGGLTWSAGIRVNQDALNNGKVQFFPCVAVDDSGGVNVAYYDNRNFPSVGDSASVMISRSLDGGTTWTDVEVADHHFRPKPTPGLGGGYMGDYIGIAAGLGKVWALWMDDKAGPFQAWAGYIQSITPPPPVEDSSICRNGLNKPITDFNLTQDTIPITIGANCNVLDVNVKIDTVIHTFISDLVVRLRKGSTSVLLVNQRGGSGANFINTRLNDSAALPISSGTAPFNGEFRPEVPLSAFNSQPVNGSWILSIRDTAASDTGVLRSWCLTIKYDCISGTGGEITTTIPGDYQLKQNYPNPFNPNTKIRFGLPKQSVVKLTIYDVLGREVGVLFEGLKTTGQHEVDFNGSNLASGIYYYKMEAGDFSDVKKMVLIK